MAEWLVLAPRNGGSRFSTTASPGRGIVGVDPPASDPNLLALLGRLEVNSVSLAPETGRLTLRLDPLPLLDALPFSPSRATLGGSEGMETVNA